LEIQGPNPTGKVKSASESFFLLHQSLQSVWSHADVVSQGITYLPFLEEYFGDLNWLIYKARNCQEGEVAEAVYDQMLLDAELAGNTGGVSDLVREFDPGEWPDIILPKTTGGRQKVTSASSEMNEKGTDKVPPPQ
jgi:hypothetical protein